jgi:hypothetical protein
MNFICFENLSHCRAGAGPGTTVSRGAVRRPRAGRADWHGGPHRDLAVTLRRPPAAAACAARRAGPGPSSAGESRRLPGLATSSFWPGMLSATGRPGRTSNWHAGIHQRLRRRPLARRDHDSPRATTLKPGGMLLFLPAGLIQGLSQQKRSEQPESEQKMNNPHCSSRGQRQGAAIVGYNPWSTS